jgi:hypothetical protein
VKTNPANHSFKAATWFLGRPGHVYLERYGRRSAEAAAAGSPSLVR